MDLRPSWCVRRWPIATPRIYGTPGVGVAVSAAGEAAERRRTRRQASRSAFYFLYQANAGLTG